jgi:hypothetical protein
VCDLLFGIMLIIYFTGMREWRTVTPKTQAELDKNPETKGKTRETDDDLSKNLWAHHKNDPACLLNRSRVRR